ncbi:MAG: hypothetical protein JNM06_12560 [Blastocatellia bacterium]|nr:hypothetical protein [Blastocatellia bacterium]
MNSAFDELKIYGELTPNISYDIVVLHPLADEQILLENLDLSPGDCTSCDLYWAWQQELFFVSIVSSQSQTPGVNYCKKSGIKFGGHNFVIFTNQCQISTSEVIKTLNFLSKYVAENKLFIEMAKTEETIKVLDVDVCA